MARVSGGNEALLKRAQSQAENKPAHANGANGSTVTGTIKALLQAPSIQARFHEVLRDRAPQFMSSIVNLVNSDPSLQKCEPMSVIASCMVAATMDLPIDKNLGYAWIVPYRDNKNNRLVAQFQMGYRGYIQLALRTGKYAKINALPIHEGELVSWNPLTEDFVFDPDARKSDKVVGYAGYFRLVNGFEKFVYWPIEQIESHRKRFSKTRQGGVWEQDYDAMALKTVIRNMLAKWGILSIEMQKAVTTDEKAADTTNAQDPIDVEWRPVDEEPVEEPEEAKPNEESKPEEQTASSEITEAETKHETTHETTEEADLFEGLEF